MLDTPQDILSLCSFSPTSLPNRYSRHLGEYRFTVTHHKRRGHLSLRVSYVGFDGVLVPTKVAELRHIRPEDLKSVLAQVIGQSKTWESRSNVEGIIAKLNRRLEVRHASAAV